LPITHPSSYSRQCLLINLFSTHSGTRVEAPVAGGISGSFQFRAASQHATPTLSMPSSSATCSTVPCPQNTSQTRFAARL
jgi:hypothetical protein